MYKETAWLGVHSDKGTGRWTDIIISIKNYRNTGTLSEKATRNSYENLNLNIKLIVTNWKTINYKNFCR